jgi:hypothetical protein
MIFAIDLDRGAMTCTHPSLGIAIYMYLDDPGVYLTEHGNVLENGETLAEQAGFDVAKFAKQRKIRAAMKNANDKIMREFNESTTKVLAERNGFKIVDLGLDRCNVLSPDGDVLNKAPIPRAQADILLDHLAPKEKDKK